MTTLNKTLKLLNAKSEIKLLNGNVYNIGDKQYIISSSMYFDTCFIFNNNDENKLGVKIYADWDLIGEYHDDNDSMIRAYEVLEDKLIKVTAPNKQFNNKSLELFNFLKLMSKSTLTKLGQKKNNLIYLREAIKAHTRLSNDEKRDLVELLENSCNYINTDRVFMAINLNTVAVNKNGDIILLDIFKELI